MLCRAPELLYPFGEHVSVCPQCSLTFHRLVWMSIVLFLHVSIKRLHAKLLDNCYYLAMLGANFNGGEHHLVCSMNSLQQTVDHHCQMLGQG